MFAGDDAPDSVKAAAAAFGSAMPVNAVHLIQQGGQGAVCIANWQGRLYACKCIPLTLDRVIAAELGAVSVLPARVCTYAAWPLVPELLMLALPRGRLCLMRHCPITRLRRCDAPAV